MKTAQQVFDTTLHHLRKQGHAATRKDADGIETCMYRAPNGDSCAVGCQIADDNYNPDIEGFGVWPVSASMVEMLRVSGLLKHERLLSSLQSAHDEQLKRVGIIAWEGKMHCIALRHKLTYTLAAI